MGPLLPVYVALSALNFQFVTACEDGKLPLFVFAFVLFIYLFYCYYYFFFFLLLLRPLGCCLFYA